MTRAQKRQVYDRWNWSRDIGWVVGWGWLTGVEVMEIGPACRLSTPPCLTTL